MPESNLLTQAGLFVGGILTSMGAGWAVLRNKAPKTPAAPAVTAISGQGLPTAEQVSPSWIVENVKAIRHNQESHPPWPKGFDSVAWDRLVRQVDANHAALVTVLAAIEAMGPTHSEHERVLREYVTEWGGQNLEDRRQMLKLLARWDREIRDATSERREPRR